MRKIRISGLLLLVMLCCLAGCSGKKKKGTSEPKQFAADSVVMMVGDHEVRYGEVQAYCYFLKCQYGKEFGDALWKYPVADNETIGDQAKQEIIDTIARLKIISDQAEEQKVELTADEEDEAMRQAESLVQGAEDEDRQTYLLTVQQVNEIYQENALAGKMFYVATNDADTMVSDAEAVQRITKEAQNSKAQGRNEEDQDISEEQIEQAKEEIIRERQNTIFIEKYNGWLENVDVDINQSFWNDFSIS